VWDRHGVRHVMILFDAAQNAYSDGRRLYLVYVWRPPWKGGSLAHCALILGSSMLSNRFRPRPPDWGYLVMLTILALTGLVLSRRLTNPGPRRMEFIGAVVCVILVLIGLYLRYRGRGKNPH
jgi:hypothetical protein